MHEKYINPSRCSSSWSPSHNQNQYQKVKTLKLKTWQDFEGILTNMFSFFPSVCWYRKQAQHPLWPGPAVPNSEEVLWKLWSRHGQPWDHEHRPQQEPHLPQGKRWTTSLHHWVILSHDKHFIGCIFVILRPDVSAAITKTSVFLQPSTAELSQMLLLTSTTLNSF